MAIRFDLLAWAPLLLLPFAAVAQGDEAEDEAVAEEAIEEVVVTGSRLPRRDFSSVSQIVTLDLAALDASGQATLEESLNRMPQLAPDFSRVSNFRGNGKAHLNLRDMGADRSLVLINGQRMAPSGIGSAVDLNALPKVLVDRVEIITGGATAVYGSDAMAGVANFILRNDFDGISVDLSSYVTEQGDSNSNDINFALGHNLANGRGNVTVYGGYLERDATFGSARDVSNVVLIDEWDGTLAETGSSHTPIGRLFDPGEIDLNGEFVTLSFDPDGNPRAFDFDTDYYNFAPLQYIQMPLRRTSGGLIFDVDLGGALEAYGAFSYAYNRIRSNNAPSPMVDYLLINVDNPVLTPATRQVFEDQLPPAEPGVVFMGYSYRFAGLGPRIIESRNRYARTVLGLRGRLGERWDFDAWATYTRGDEEMLHFGAASYARVQQGLLVDPVTGQCLDQTGGCVPLDLFGEGRLAPEGLEFVRYAPFRDVTKREQQNVAAFVRGLPFSTWAGEVPVAFGLEWRSDQGRYTADEALSTGDAIGFGADPSVEGTERVYEVYAEAAIPLAQELGWAEFLGLEIGGRLSEYDHAGRVNTWKLGAEWELPVPLRFRAMFQRAVRAPSLDEAFEEQVENFGTFVGSDSRDDPCSASRDPLNSGLAGACMATGIPEDQLGVFEATPGTVALFIDGGNPGLAPETSETVTAGVVLDIDWLGGVQLSVDYFEIDIRGTIGRLDPVSACYDAVNIGHAFCENIVRDPTDFNVTEVRSYNINRGLLRTKGIDTTIHVETDLPASLGLFDGDAGISFNATWTHTLENSYQTTPFGSVVDCAGTFGWPCQDEKWTMTFPEDRVAADVSYHSGDLLVGLYTRWIRGTDNGLLRNGWVYGLFDLDLGNPHASARFYGDLSVSYRISETVRANLSVANLWDTDPPLQVDTRNTNTDSANYDIFGRAYTLGLSMQF